MRRASSICRYLLAALFLIFGVNGFFHFIKIPPPSLAYGVQFQAAVNGSHFMLMVFTLEVLSGVSLLADLYAPLALVVLGGIIANILVYHITMDPAGFPPAILATILWLLTVVNYRENYRGMLAAKALDESA